MLFAAGDMFVPLVLLSVARTIFVAKTHHTTHNFQLSIFILVSVYTFQLQSVPLLNVAKSCISVFQPCVHIILHFHLSHNYYYCVYKPEHDSCLQTGTDKVTIGQQFTLSSHITQWPLTHCSNSSSNTICLATTHAERNECFYKHCCPIGDTELL